MRGFWGKVAPQVLPQNQGNELDMMISSQTRKCNPILHDLRSDRQNSLISRQNEIGPFFFSKSEILHRFCRLSSHPRATHVKNRCTEARPGFSVWLRAKQEVAPSTSRKGGRGGAQRAASPSTMDRGNSLTISAFDFSSNVP